MQTVLLLVLVSKPAKDKNMISRGKWNNIYGVSISTVDDNSGLISLTYSGFISMVHRGTISMG